MIKKKLKTTHAWFERTRIPDDLIEEIRDKKNQLEKQNRLSKTERLHKAIECLNDLDDPTDEQAIMTRLMIVFTKAITPDGVVIPLADAQAAGLLGEAGVAGYVNNHFMQRIGFAVVASVVNTLLQTAPIIALDKLIGKGGGHTF